MLGRKLSSNAVKKLNRVSVLGCQKSRQRTDDDESQHFKSWDRMYCREHIELWKVQCPATCFEVAEWNWNVTAYNQFNCNICGGTIQKEGGQELFSMQSILLILHMHVSIPSTLKPVGIFQLRFLHIIWWMQHFYFLHFQETSCRRLKSDCIGRIQDRSAFRQCQNISSSMCVLQ